VDVVGDTSADTSGSHDAYLRLQAQVVAFEAQVAALEARVAALEAAAAPPPPAEQADVTPVWGTARSLDERAGAGKDDGDSPAWGTPDRHDPRAEGRGDYDAGFVDYRTRAASSVDDVDEVCCTIAGESSTGLFPVRLSGVDWLVLDVVGTKADHRALLLADRVIAKGPYHGADTEVTWELCDLRRWLNDDFCRSLGEPLTSRVVETEVLAEPNPEWGTPGGAHTSDRFFLLSMGESVRYLAGNQVRKSWSTLGERGTAWCEDGTASWWWLRSPGWYGDHAAYVSGTGDVYARGFRVSAAWGVRPAFWLDLRSAHRSTITQDVPHHRKRS